MDNAPDVSVSPPAPSAPSAPAESSPATLQIPHKDDPAYLEWRKTGEIPDPKVSKPKSAESAPAKTKPQEESAPSSAEGEEPEETAPGSEPGQRQEQRRTGASERLQEILGDLKRAGLSPSELKSFKREAQQARPPETTAQPLPQPPPQEPPKPPVLDDFKSWDEFRKAEFEYNQYATREMIRAEMAQLVAQHAQTQANQTAAQKLEDAAARYGETAKDTISSTAQSLFSDAQIHPAIKGIVNDSPVIADLLYVMGSKSNEFQEFLALAKTNPGQAIRKAVLLEQLVQEELAKGKASTENGNGAERDESGRFVKPPPARPRAEAPPPTREVSGRASPPADEVDAAFSRAEKNPIAARDYFAAANRADLAARRGR